MGQLNELRSRRPSRATPNISISDGEGLYLRVRTTAKAWVYRYKRGGKETKLSLGPYPALSLAAARKKARTDAEKLADGVDPMAVRREEKERRPQHVCPLARR
jgi:hypothetical protein